MKGRCWAVSRSFRTGASRAAIALLFGALALPAAAQYISSPHALFQSSLNGVAVRLCNLTETGGLHLDTQYYTLRGWPAAGAGTLTINNVTEAAGNCADLNLSYTGSFSVDQQIHFDYSDFVSLGGSNGTTGTIWVFAADPALVVGDVAGTPTEEGGSATIPVRLRTRPAGNVTVAVTSTDTTEGTVSPSSLTFTQGNWNANQTVTATGANDNLNDGDTAWNVRLNPASISGATVIDSDYNGLANVNVSVTTLDQTGGPTISAFGIVSSPANAAGYRVGENIDVRLTFSNDVAVTGTPLLALRIGTETRQARYESGAGRVLVFRYPVLPGDADADGISVGAGAGPLTLNGGSIVLSGGTAHARLNFSSTITNDANHRVDGTQGAPGISAIALNSPQVGTAYERLEPIDVTLTFSKAVSVVGLPRVALTIGTATRQAVYDRDLSTDTKLVFRYTVVQADVDTDGISVGGRALTLGGAVIRDAASTTNALLVIGHRAIADSANHRVTGNLFNAPKIIGNDLVSSPVSSNGYRLGEIIELHYTFDRPVVVTGTPTQIFRYDPATGGAVTVSYVAAASTPTVLSFQDIVDAGERKPGGVLIYEPITLGSATIQDARDPTVAAVLTLGAVRNEDDRSGHDVYGPLQSDPSVTALTLNAPVIGDTYERGETIEARVTYDRVVEVTGAPQLAIRIGSNTRQADYLRSERTGRDLLFRYTLVQADVDSDGLSIAADALTLNGGTIRLHTVTRNANLGLGSRAITNDGARKVDGTRLTAPSIRRVWFRTAPASGDTFELNEQVQVALLFNRPVTTTGMPRLALGVGAAVRHASYWRTSGVRVLFRYRFHAGDVDSDGLSIAADALTLNAGAINDARDATVAANLNLGLNAITDAAQYKVDARRGPPGIAGLTLNAPVLGDTYNLGETIEATVRFNKNVDVTGTPQLALDIGANTRQANYASGTGSTALVFRYTVVAADVDADGLTIEGGALTLNSGTIRVAGGSTDAVLSLGPLAFSNNPSYKVDGTDAPRAFITTTPSSLTEDNLGGATVTLGLANTAFASGVVQSHFTLVTGVPGLNVASLAPVASGDTTATLTLSYTNADFDTPQTLAVTVAASAHAQSGAVTSSSVPVRPTFDLSVNPTLLALNENPGSTNANVRTYAVAVGQAPTAPAIVTVGGATPAVRVDTATAPGDQHALTFTASNWNTPQMVTVTAAGDDDVDDEAVTLTHSVPVDGNRATVRVTVTDDDIGRVLVDANPATAALDPGPLLLSEASGDANNSQSYTVRLSVRPSADVVVAAASDDPAVAAVSPSVLTFSTQNWNTAQTLTATAVADSDAVDESTTLVHEANGGGYNGTAGRLRAAVSDDTRANTDYDTDEDGLIEVSTLSRLNAIRWDPDGDGTAIASGLGPYAAAFGNAAAGMGCPAGPGGAPACIGYELTQDLDFDFDGDGSTHSGGVGDADDSFYNGGSGWDPIGPSLTGLFYQQSVDAIAEQSFNAVFDGNGHHIRNLFINRTRAWTGLFAALRPNAVVRSVGLPNAYVTGGASVATLAGTIHGGRVEATWVSGTVTGTGNVGGLAGTAQPGSTIVASYSTAAVQCTVVGPSNWGGGLTADSSGAIIASYAIGAVTGCATQSRHGLAGGAGTATASYWDTVASGVSASDLGSGRNTTQLQSPTSATGIYAGWDALDVDADGDPSEAPWDFGTSSQYPALSYRGADPVAQRGDYDTDNDGLIEVTTLDQLNAIRWDLDGDGAPVSNNAANYGKAFRNHLPTMGCPTDTNDADDNDCRGYELMNDLDFDTDDDGSTWTDSGTFTPDSGDAWHDGGNGWDPIGPADAPADTTHFNAVFDGNGKVIANLLVNRNRNHAGLFAALRPNAVVRALGLPNARVRDAQGTAGALVGNNAGRVAGAWASGAVQGGTNIGGLAGTSAGTIVASYSTASVVCSWTGNRDAGGLTAGNTGTIAASYSTGTVTGNCDNLRGLAGGSGTFTASYWDVNLSNIADDAGTASPEGETSANLRAPTAYGSSGLYAAWDDQDVDNDGTTGRALDSDDDAWEFGDQWQWPVLKFGGLDTQRQIALQPNTAPTFGAGTVSDKHYRRNFQIQAFQIPAASGGEGTPYSYSAIGLPAGLSFGPPNCAVRTVCGTPNSIAAARTVAIHAHDGDTNRADSDRAELTFMMSVVEPTATLTTSPSPLTEATINGAEVTVTLTGSTFESGVTAASFTLNTNVPGLRIGSLATVTAGDTTATLTLAHNGQDFDTARTLGVTVAAAAHALPGTVTSATVPVTPSLEATVSPPNLFLNESTAGGGNVGTFTAVLQSAPTGTVTSTLGSVASVTVTAGTGTYGFAYPVTFSAPQTPGGTTATGTMVLSGTTPTGVTITNPGSGYTSPPTVTFPAPDTAGTAARGTAVLAIGMVTGTTVAVASSDAGAATVDPALLTFTATNWNTAQTVTVTAQADNDEDNESVAATLSASGVGVLATVSVTVTDDDRGTVLLDADPATPALDPGPLLVGEGDSGGYSVRLSAPPIGNVTVAVASGDTGGVTVSPSSLTFTTIDWNTAQTVTATAVSDANSTDESVNVTHTATGGGYGGTSSTLRVGVSDDERSATDYDTDEDGLIEVTTLAQLNAIRWDLDGDGTVAAGDLSNYQAAFSGYTATAGIGCPTDGCIGYELTQDLDFDTDGDGSSWAGATPASDADDDYHNGGNGWDPIGPNISTTFEVRVQRIADESFNAVFDGNGHSIHNLFINRSRDWAGLFAALRPNAVVRSLGVPNARIVGAGASTAPLAGSVRGRVEAAWATGAVQGTGNVGGLVGTTETGSAIVASYARTAVDCTLSQPDNVGGGLAAWNQGAIAASYAIGAVTCVSSGSYGLAGGPGTATGSHWDMEASGVPASTQGRGRTTAQLQTPTSATGIFAGWDALDVDGDGDPREAPWHFGTDSQYPVLSYRGADPILQRGDYDLDDDGLIEVYTLAQLNAIRWDLDGDGDPATASVGSYGKAFRNHLETMGCPADTTGDADNHDCTGYELENDLDFDTDGDGSTWTEPSGTFTADSGDAYHNGGSGWDPIGPQLLVGNPPLFNATLNGNGHAIDNLLVNRLVSYSGLFSVLGSGAEVRALGLPNARVRRAQAFAGALVGANLGRVSAVWASGAIAATNGVGGLVGGNESGGAIVASYSTATVVCDSTNVTGGGGLAGQNAGSIATSYSTGTVTGAMCEGGLIGTGTGTVTASYWDVNVSGIADDAGTASPEGETSANLRMPTGYSGLYADWDDQDVDNDGTTGATLDSDDDAWDFGDQWQWPVLKFGGLDTARQVALQPNTAPTFTGSVTNKTYRRNFQIQAFTVPAASGGEVANYTYSASGLPAGLDFEAPNCAARTVCGTPTTNTTGAATVTIYAHDGDTNLADSDRAELTFTITVVEPTATIATSPSPLTEATINGAEVTVTLTDTTFESGVTSASFTLNTNVPGLSIGSLATVTAGDTTATLTLAHNGQDFDTARTVGVTVAASAHTLAGTIATATVPVTTSLEATVSPPNLSLNENSAGNANVGTFTAVLQSAPASDTTVSVTSSDTGAATVDPSSLTFTTLNWNTAQTVTVTAQADDDPDGEMVTVTLAASGVGVLATVAVTVTDNDRGTVLIDADPATPAQDPGPLLLGEGDSGGYSVRLSARPIGNVTVAVASGDTGAVTVAPSSLTFTTVDWNTAQTVTATAVGDANSMDESVHVTHTATGGGYGGTSSSLRVGVSDDERSATDHDTDEDGLIEVSTLAQLNAIRWDLNGDGAVAAGDLSNYQAAFSGYTAAAGAGCPTGGCSGYELTRDLDFDTDGDGSTWSGATPTSDSGDTYHNSGNGWDPIGPTSTPSDTTHFNAVFDGNGHSIHNLFVSRSRNYSGLFAALRGSAVVRSLGLPNARVQSGQGTVGILAGAVAGRVEASWTSGAAAGQTNVGGLVGTVAAGATVVASYSTASAACESGASRVAGGLAGDNAGAIEASYATGAVTGGCPTANKHGLAGGAGTATASHWDTVASSVSVSTQGRGRTTAQLQTPTSAAGIFAGWDALDVDGDGDRREAPWHFGTDSQYPVLSYRGADPVPQRGDYDLDDDGLIEVRTLAQLNAIRWDLDGNGDPASASAADYGKVFRNHMETMGCPTNTDDADNHDCTGYELENDLDFDTDDDGSTWTAPSGTFTADSGDAYYNGGSGWDPIGPDTSVGDTTHFNATFEGNGHVIENLLVNRRTENRNGLFRSLRTSAVARSLGLPNARVQDATNFAGALAGTNVGRVAAVWASGTVRVADGAGGLVGGNDSGGTIAASYSTAAAECTGSGSTFGGGLAGRNNGSIVTSYSTGAVTGASCAGGLIGGGTGTVTASYWDTNLSGINDDSDANPPEGETSANLRAPTGYSGLYAVWDDQDVDNDGTTGRALDSDDDAWDFGDQWQWPVLKFGGLDTARQVALQPNVPPTFGTGVVSNKTYRRDFRIQPFQIPAASGGEVANYTYSASGLPAGLNFAAPNCAARTVCGTPTTNTAGAATVTIHAHDGDTNLADSDRAELTFTITVVSPTAAITATSPAALTEANLNNATVTVTLTDTAFASGVTQSHFTLGGNVPGLNIASLATVSDGDTSATLTLSYNNANFTAVRTLSVTVAAAAHDLAGSLTTATVSVAPTPGIALSRTMLTVEEDPTAGGGTNANVGTYTVVLTANPRTAAGLTCVVNLTATSNNADVAIDTDATPQTKALSFDPSNWNTPQTVTVTAVADGDGQNDAATISHARTSGTCAGGFFGTPSLPSLSVTVNDNDTAGIVLDADPATANIDEAGPLTLRELSTATDKTRSYTVRLAVEPTQNVTVTITSSDTSSVTVGDTDSVMPGTQNTLAFSSSTWDTAQTVTLRAEDDGNGVGESVTITHAASTASQSEYTGISVTLTANVVDDEAPGFIFDADPSTAATDEAGPLALVEGHAMDASKSYTVRLSAQPTQDATVTIASGDTTAVTVDDTDGVMPNVQNTLIFTTMNWDTRQTVTLTAQDDDGAANESVAITHTANTATSSEYTNVTADFTASVDDDETPAITLSAPTLAVVERNSATYTVRLATPPEEGSVTVDVTGAQDGISTNPTRLVFTSSNWNTARIVTVSAADDPNGANEMVTLTHEASGGEYDGVEEDIVVTATDDDAPSLLVSPTRLPVRENASASYLIRLNTQPSATVTVTIGGTTTEVTADADDTTPGDQTTLTFTAQNWSANRTVTVSAADDDDSTDETVNLTHAATGGDYTSLALGSRPGVTVEVDDDDTPAILLDADPSTTNADEAGPLALNELSGHADNAKGYTVRLATQPTANVEVSVSSGDRAVAVDTDATPRTLTLTFTMSNWGTAQTVTATAAEDDDASNERVTISHSATGGGYDGVTAALSATTVDDDEPAIVVAATTLIGSGATEGATATYTVRLDTEPTGEVRVTAMATGGVAVDMDPGQAGGQRWLRFDATTWNTARTVSVRGVEDDDAADGTATIRHSSSGADYGRAPAAEIEFAVTDNDTPAVLADPTAVELNEGSSATYSIRLAVLPTGEAVEVSPTSSDDAVATVSPSTLTFDATNWNQPRQVSVTGVADGSASVTHAATGADYGGASTPTVTVTVRDTDAAGVRIEPPTLRIREGGSETYRVRLNTQPSGDVLVTPTAAPGSEALSMDADGTAMTFTSQNWSVEQTQRWMAAHDDDIADETLSVLHLVTGYTGVTTAPALSVLVEDDDAAGIEFAPADGLSLTEGGAATATYTAVLTAEPTADVTVSLSSDDAGLAFDADDGTPGDQTALTFTMANWNTARTLAVRAVADADAATEEVTLLHSASGGGYDDVVAAYEVRVSDADAAPAPARVEAAAAGETSLSVSWSASPGARGYWVQWRVVGGEWSLDRLIEVSAAGSSVSGGGRTLRVATGPLSARIDGLLRGQRYEVRVLALNRGDPGDPSTVVSATPAAQPSGGAGAPQVANALGALVLEAGGTEEIDLSEAFRDPDGDVLTYAAWSSDEEVVTVRIDAQVLVVGAGRPGSARLTMEATDPGGLSVRTTVDVDVVGTQCKTELAQAPEGGVAVVTAELSEPARSLTTVRWRAVADADPATADADAGEHGDASGEGASGEAVFNVGERCAEIEIPILDDAVAEPSREWFALELELRFANLGRLVRQQIPVAVLEGVCDRTPAVRDALLAATDTDACETPGPAQLGGVRTLKLAGLDMRTLASGDLGELSNLRTLDLSNNALSEVPSLSALARLERLLLSGNALTKVPWETLASLERLRDLDLSGNALEDLSPMALEDLPGLRVLRLDGNDIETLPDGVFAGLSELRLLRLDANPGAPFALALELQRTDAATWAPPPARVRVSAPSGAPFDLSVALSVEGGTFADDATTATAVVPAGETASARLRVSAQGFARVSLSSPPFPSRLCLGEPCWRGFEFALGEPLALFVREIEVLPAPQPEALFGDALRVPLSSLAMAGEADGELQWQVTSSDPSLATVRIVDGHLVIESAPGVEGVVRVEATATDASGQTATVRFDVPVDYYHRASPLRGWRSALPQERSSSSSPLVE